MAPLKTNLSTGNRPKPAQKSILSYFKPKAANGEVVPPVKRSLGGGGDANVSQKKIKVITLDQEVVCVSKSTCDDPDDQVIVPPVKEDQIVPVISSAPGTNIALNIVDDDTIDGNFSNDAFDTTENFVDLESYLAIELDHGEQNISSEIENGLTETTSQESDYRLHNFKAMMDYVLNDTHNHHLFNDNDWNIIESFTSLSVPAQRLYIRLYLRKHRWIRGSKLNYPEIAKELEPFMKELVAKKLLVACSTIENLEVALNLLEIPELRSCSKSLKGVKFTQCNTKTKMIDAIIKHSKSSQSIQSHFSGKMLSVDTVILNFVKRILGSSCYCVDQTYGSLFSRMTYLYYPPQVNEDENGVALSHEFFNAEKVEKGEMSFPAYNVNKASVIYQTRADLMRYESACRLESKVLSEIEKRHFDIVVEKLLPEAEKAIEQIFADGLYKHDETLLPFLRNLTAGHVYVRCLNHISAVLESNKLYERAVTVLQYIVKQNVYCQHYKGKWCERLALDLEAHLKKPQDALKVISSALNDTNVKLAFRYSIYKRGKRLINSMEKKGKDFNELLACPEYEFKKCPEKVIEAPTLQTPVSGRRTIFTSTSAPGSTTCLPVEEVAILYYKQRGFTNGLHTERHAYHVLYNLLFWDIIYYDGTPDAFRTPNQSLPLDFASDHFYLRRTDMIEARLFEIRNMSDEALCEELDSRWTDNVGCVCLIHWDSVTINDIKEIAVCMGPVPLAAICERLITNFRFGRSGFPDLIVWNRMEKSIKAVEVKGPGDSLSAKQILWLDYMNDCGLPAEVCYVKASGGSKMLKNKIIHTPV